MSTLKLTRLTVAILIFFISICLFPQENPTGSKGRNFMLVFDVIEYSSQVKEAVSYFLENVFQEGDGLIIVSPVKLVGFSPEKLNIPREKLTKQIADMLKTDIAKGMEKYRSIMDEMRLGVMTLREGALDIQAVLENYKNYRQLLSALRGNLEEKLMKYAKLFIQARSDQKENHLVMILQRDNRPVPDKDVMSRLRQGVTSFGFQATEIFMADPEEAGPDIQKLEGAFKYAKVRFHIMYLQTKSPHSSRGGVEYIENTGNIYSVFGKIAKATDGLDISTNTPVQFFKKVEQLVEGKVEVEVIDETMKEEKKE